MKTDHRDTVLILVHSSRKNGNQWAYLREKKWGWGANYIVSSIGSYLNLKPANLLTCVDKMMLAKGEEKDKFNRFTENEWSRMSHFLVNDHPLLEGSNSPSWSPEFSAVIAA